MNLNSPLKITKHYFERKDDLDMGVNGPFPPVMVDLHPTLACQNRCFFCISANTHVAGVERPNYDRKHTLDWDVLKNVISELDFMGVKSIQLTGGGEPTLYPHFGDLLEEIHPHRRVHRYPSPSIGLITNGIIAGEYADDIVGACDWVRFSLDASNPGMYKQIKSADHFGEVIASLEKLLEVRKKKKAPRIGVAYILTTESIGGIREVCTLMNEIKPDYLQFRDVINRGLEFNNEYRGQIESAIRIAREESTIPILYTSHEHIGQRPTFKDCPILDYVAVLGADGEVYGCCHHEYQPKASYGSIYKKKFADIWAKRPALEIDADLCWQCRFTKSNEVLRELKEIKDGGFL